MIVKPLIKATSIYGMNSLMEYLLDISIQAVEGLTYKDLYRNWAILLENYSMDKKEIEAHKESVINTLTQLKETWHLDNASLGWSKGLSYPWYNTLKSTLYMIESELMKAGRSEQVYNCWDMFFQEDMFRNDTYIHKLNIIKL